jgi:hypothetical protein
VLEKIVAEYEVDEAVAAQDLQGLVAKLIEINAIEKV